MIWPSGTEPLSDQSFSTTPTPIVRDVPQHQPCDEQHAEQRRGDSGQQPEHAIHISIRRENCGRDSRGLFAYDRRINNCQMTVGRTILSVPENTDRIVRATSVIDAPVLRSIVRTCGRAPMSCAGSRSPWRSFCNTAIYCSTACSAFSGVSSLAAAREPVDPAAAAMSCVGIRR